MVDSAAFGQVLSTFWTPLVAVTTAWEGRENGQIAVSAIGASVVPEHPRILVQLYKTNWTHDLVLKSRVFALHLLREDQLDLAHALGFVSGRVNDKLSRLAHRTGLTGSPILHDCLGWLDCNVIDTLDGGDMTCFLADVVDGGVNDRSALPLWWRDMRARMPESWHREWTAKIAGEIEVATATMRHAEP